MMNELEPLSIVISNSYIMQVQEKGCSGGGCTCLKAGLKCSALCKFGSGVSCQNVTLFQIAKDSEDYDGPLTVLQAESSNFETPTKREKLIIQYHIFSCEYAYSY